MSFYEDEFQVVEIPSSIDTSVQKAIFRKAKNNGQPLIVSFHTWGGDYAQNDPLRDKISDEDWNYIFPDFRGPNKQSKSCMSELVVADVEDAINFALSNIDDVKKVVLIGRSGGGGVVLKSYLNLDVKIDAFIAWCPVTDLESFYYHSLCVGDEYSSDIISCVNNDLSLMNARSPIHDKTNVPVNSLLEIYAGIHDGCTGPVSITHSVDFYNKIMRYMNWEHEVVQDDVIIKLLARSIPAISGYEIGDRKVYLLKERYPFSLTVFDGGHEMLVDYSIERIKKIISAH
ncbi:MAG: alpha/beta hydrolase [Prosthecochloris sp.]|nr:alpha/beta hydrolase [Prosthecochloris sp.]